MQMVNAGMLLNGFLGVVHLQFLSINERHVGKVFKENLDNNIRQKYGNIETRYRPKVWTTETRSMPAPPWSTLIVSPL